MAIKTPKLKSKDSKNNKLGEKKERNIKFVFEVDFDLSKKKLK